VVWVVGWSGTIDGVGGGVSDNQQLEKIVCGVDITWGGACKDNQCRQDGCRQKQIERVRL
jgi:hypothetical protein